MRLLLCMPLLLLSCLEAQDPVLRQGRGVPAMVQAINYRGLQYLAQTQVADGSWPGGANGSGLTGICLMAMLASGEDPDFGPYARNVRRAVRRLIRDQDGETGHMTGSGHGSMYHHGFATLALSEAYGAVNERLLWLDSDVPEEERRSIGQALDLAVRCIVTSQQQNPWHAWRYSPEGQDADTTVSGTVLMGLLGARNAGIEIPNKSIDDALGYFRINTRSDGVVSYQPTASHGDGSCRAAIATLVFAMARRKDLEQYQAAAKFVKSKMGDSIFSHEFYHRYYLAQALFHSDFEAWQAWNRETIELLRQRQEEDGSFSSNHGLAYGTGMSLLALALNYRLLPVYER